MTKSKVSDSNRSDKALLRLPYDWRRPTISRLKSRSWNADDPRLLTPKSFGWGYTINFYWLFHGRQPRK